MPSSKVERLRLNYESKLGKNLVSKLSDDQIKLLSKYYNSLSDKEQSDIDSRILMGYDDTDLHEMARGMIEEDEDDEVIPEGLDDILNDIQKPEPKVTTIKASAIVPAKFFGEDRYQKYVNELTSEGTIEGETLTPEERKEGFKKRGNKIDFEKFVEKVLSKKKPDKESIDSGGAIVRAPKMNIQKITPPDTFDRTQENLDEILKGIDSILETLKADQETKKESSEFDRKKREKDKRKLQESRLEKRFSGLKKAAEKIIAPVKSILDRIIQFFVTVLLGRVVYKLIEWLGDPENKGKIDSILRFIKDWWPALLSAYILFGTSFGKFTRAILSTVTRFIFKIGKKAIPQLIQAAAKNPVTAALVVGGTLAAGGAYVASQQNERRREEAAKKDPNIVTPKQTAETGKTPSGTQLQQEQILQRGLQMFRGGGLANKSTNNNFYGDDEDSGYVSGQSGIDKIPAMLSDGEFVMSRGAVQKYGVKTLEAMNAAGGGTNKPKIVQGVSYAAGGGMIGDDKDTSSTQPLVGNYKIAFNTIRANFPQAKPYHIAAAIGNFETEAPGLKPNTYQYGGGPGRGIAQWETPGRWETAEKKYGKGIINNLNQQLNFMKWELDTGHPDSQGRPNLPYGNATKNEWLKSKNLNEATLNFMNAYEAPGVPHTERRLKNAQNILSSYKKTSTEQKNKYAKQEKKSKVTSKPNIFERGVTKVRKFLGFNDGGLVLPAFSSGGMVGKRKMIGDDEPPSPEEYGGAPKESASMMDIPSGSTISSNLKPSVNLDLNSNERDSKIGAGSNQKGKHAEAMKMLRGYTEGGVNYPIEENTGIDIPGATADRQLIAVQPGEHNFIVPKDSVDRGAIPLINMIVAATDSNSAAYKDGFKSKIPGPPVKSSPKVTFINAGVNNNGDTTLPPAVSGAPSFDATSASRSKVRTLGLINF